MHDGNNSLIVIRVATKFVLILVSANNTNFHLAAAEVFALILPILVRQDNLTTSARNSLSSEVLKGVAP